jgi:hypothetical protein
VFIPLGLFWLFVTGCMAYYGIVGPAATGASV